MRDRIQGRPFHGEFTSADASALTEAASRFTLYDSSKNAITLTDNERVIITDIDILAGAALTVTLYDGINNNPAGSERIWLGSLAANGGISRTLGVPHYCRNNASTGTPAGYPKVKTSGAGQIDATIRGVIERLGQ